jgi:hypothetical protein
MHPRTSEKNRARSSHQKCGGARLICWRVCGAAERFIQDLLIPHTCISPILVVRHIRAVLAELPTRFYSTCVASIDLARWTNNAAVKKMGLWPIKQNHHHNDHRPTRTWKKAAWRLGAAFVIIWIWASVTSMVSLFHNWHDDPTDHAAAGRRVVCRSSDNDGSKQQEFVLCSQRETYFEDCRQTMLRNATWGAERAPLVDKIQAKHWAREWSRSVQIVPTLAIFDETNISSLIAMDTLQHHLTQPFCRQGGAHVRRGRPGAK